MTNKLSTIAATCIALIPLGTAAALTIVNPTERMVYVPGLSYMGASRISTVEFCAKQTGTNWQQLITDSDFESMESCLADNT